MAATTDVMGDISSAGNRWSAFKTLIRGEAGRLGRIMEVEDNYPPSEEALDFKPLKARAWVLCASCESVTEILYEAKPPADGWGGLLPVGAEETARNPGCSCI